MNAFTALAVTVQRNEREVLQKSRVVTDPRLVELLVGKDGCRKWRSRDVSFQYEQGRFTSMKAAAPMGRRARSIVRYVDNRTVCG
jgi:hypothetical protein